MFQVSFSSERFTFNCFSYNPIAESVAPILSCKKQNSLRGKLRISFARNCIYLYEYSNITHSKCNRVNSPHGSSCRPCRCCSNRKNQGSMTYQIIAPAAVASICIQIITSLIPSVSTSRRLILLHEIVFRVRILVRELPLLNVISEIHFSL